MTPQSVTTSLTRVEPSLPECVRPLGDGLPVEQHREALASHIDGAYDVRVLGFRGQEKTLPEDIQAPVAPDETDHMVPPSLGLPQGDGWRRLAGREPQGVRQRVQRARGRVAAQPGV